jgi:hypothetical protein
MESNVVGGKVEMLYPEAIGSGAETIIETTR